MEDIGEDLLLGDAEVHVLVVGVRALVDDPVHVQVQMIKLWDLGKGKKKQLLILFSLKNVCK